MLTAVTKKLHFRCCTSPKSATGCKFENWEQIFVEKTKSNFGGIAREIYKFRMQKWCESFENACVFKVIRPLTFADKNWNYGKLSKKKQLMFRHGIAWHHKMSKSNIFNNRKHGMKATCKFLLMQNFYDTWLYDIIVLLLIALSFFTRLVFSLLSLQYKHGNLQFQKWCDSAIYLLNFKFI